MSVSTCGGLIHGGLILGGGGLIVGGLRYTFDDSLNGYVITLSH